MKRNIILSFSFGSCCVLEYKSLLFLLRFYETCVLWMSRHKQTIKKKLEKNTLELILGIKYITLRDERKQRFVAI